MNAKPLVVYVAAGAGIGHLVRAMAVCNAVAQKGLNARILTHCRHVPWLSRLVQIPIDFLSSRDWVKHAAEFALSGKPDLMVLDTFPWGLRGEWAGISRNGLPVVFIARRLRVLSYLAAAGLTWDRKSPVFRRVIVSEPLGHDYWAFLTDSASELHVLPGRIRLSPSHLIQPVPRELRTLLSKERVWLVVHSGPRGEVDRLVYLARLGIEKEGKGAVAVIAPVGLNDASYPVFQYFPASRLYGSAHRVVTGAGYNTVAEMSFYPEKWLPLAFERRYDDQLGRLSEAAGDLSDGSAEVARIITDELSGVAKSMLANNSISMKK